MVVEFSVSGGDAALHSRLSARHGFAGAGAPFAETLDQVPAATSRGSRLARIAEPIVEITFSVWNLERYLIPRSGAASRGPDDEHRENVTLKPTKIRAHAARATFSFSIFPRHLRNQ